MSAVDLWIGIDPGTTTGVALYDAVSEELLELHTMDFWSAFTWCTMSSAKHVAIEVSSKKTSFRQLPGGAKAVFATGVNVGSVLRESKLLADGLEKIGKHVVRVEPQGKLDHKKFCRLTGWDVNILTNEHQRDSALQIYRRKTGR